MRKSIFMYLFFFAILFIIFQYMNEKTIFEAQEKKITALTEKVAANDAVIDSLNQRVVDLDYFTLQGNENAMVYLESSGYEAAAVEALVSDVIYENNFVTEGNPLVPFEGMTGPMRVNKVRFLNHRWVLADFTDGTYWGEMILEYTLNTQQQLEFNTLASLLYPKS
ncbi:hydrolase [uncultured Altibacter sp.]|uniref:hydrolase n=1 Tax=uncultured Altibacter sp. TaxID=2506933 RepID=UPI0030D9975F